MPVRVAERVLTELAEIVGRLQQDDDPQRFRADLDRWKRRAVKSLSQVVPPRELEPFARLSTEPWWNAADEGRDPITPVLDGHRAEIESLIEDMRRNPSSYGQQVVAALSKKAERPRHGSSLPLPEKVTIAWLVRHVPVQLWSGFALLVLAVFALGVRVGMVPQAAGWLAPLMGVDPTRPVSRDSLAEDSAPLLVASTVTLPDSVARKLRAAGLDLSDGVLVGNVRFADDQMLGRPTLRAVVRNRSFTGALVRAVIVMYLSQEGTVIGDVFCTPTPGEPSVLRMLNPSVTTCNVTPNPIRHGYVADLEATLVGVPSVARRDTAVVAVMFRGSR